jgi:hypothetical protein
MISELQRIPKWMLEERFALYHEENLKSRGPRLVFRVQIFNATADPFDGYGNSIAEAAKEARKARTNKTIK